MASRRRLTPYLLLPVLVLGTGLGIGFGLSGAPSAGPRPAAAKTPTLHSGVASGPKSDEATPTKAAHSVVVPEVIGELPAQAESSLSEAGLQPSFTPESSQTVPLSIVLAESPAAGRTVPQGSTVTVTQSSGAPISGSAAPSYPPTPSPILTTALCQPPELAAASVSYDNGGTVLSLVFFLANIGGAPCSVPAVASVAFRTSTGNAFGAPNPQSDPPLPSGFFELQAQSANRVSLITEIDNWCGTPTPPTTADITLSGAGTVAVPVNPRFIGRGIACDNASYPPGFASPVQVNLLTNS